MSLDPNFFCQYAPCDNQNLLAELVAMASIQQFQKREIILEMGTQQKWFYLLKQGGSLFVFSTKRWFGNH